MANSANAFSLFARNSPSPIASNTRQGVAPKQERPVMSSSSIAGPKNGVLDPKSPTIAALHCRYGSLRRPAAVQVRPLATTS